MFDAKHFEFVYSSERLESNTDFPEYVYWWMGKYTVDKETGGVRNLKRVEDVDDHRLKYFNIYPYYIMI